MSYLDSSLAIGPAQEAGIKQYRPATGEGCAGLGKQCTIGAVSPLLTIESLTEGVGSWLNGIEAGKTFPHSIRGVECPAQFALESQRQSTFTSTHESTDQHERGTGRATDIAGRQGKERCRLLACEIALSFRDFWLV